MIKSGLLSLLSSVFIILCLAGSGSAWAADAGHNVSLSKQAGDYAISLKLLPPEPFTPKSQADSNKGEMVRGGGAQPVAKGGSAHPNHHLVVFLKKDGKPVENAKVKISYQKQGSSKTVNVPVTRMWVAGVGPKTTHYGNNVDLAPGRYTVHVVVNQKAKADFDLTVQ